MAKIDIVKMRTLRTLAVQFLLGVSLYAQVQTIDLKPYGFRPVTNPDYRARLFPSAMDYLADGTLVVGFPSPVDSLNPSHEHTLGEQRTTVLHIDPATGRLLQRFETLVSYSVRFLSATPDGGFLKIDDRAIVFYSKDCVEKGSMELPLDLETVDIAPSRKFLSITAASNDKLHVTLVDSTTKASIRQFEVAAGPVTILGNGYAFLERYSVSGLGVGVSRRTTIVNEGHTIHFVTARPTTFDLGFAMSCPVSFDAASDDSIAFSTCGALQVVNQTGERMFRDKFRNFAVIRFATSMKSSRLAYSIVRAAGQSTEELRTMGSDFRIRVADISAKRVITTVPISPFPKTGGSFALSPDGSALAVLGEGSIQVSHLP